MSKVIHYDDSDNIIYYKDSNGYEEWREYNENGNLIHYKNSNGKEYWYDYDENGNCIKINSMVSKNVK